MYRFPHSDASRRSFLPPSPARFGDRDAPFGDLLTFLEAEPGVVSYDVLHGGILDVRYWGGRILVGALPSSGSDRLRMQALKRDHERAGRRVILIPQARLARRPFRENRRLVAASAGIALSADQRLRILDAVDETGSATLGDLARMIGTCRAAEGILALVANGTLEIDLREPIDGNSVLSRFEPGA